MDGGPIAQLFGFEHATDGRVVERRVDQPVGEFLGLDRSQARGGLGGSDEAQTQRGHPFQHGGESHGPGL